MFDFDQITIINLKRRPDRLKQIQDEIKNANWPFREPGVLQAVDGDLVSPPEGYKEGNYAWACFQSHRLAVQNALNNKADSLLILEDDATFVEGFADKAKFFFENVPEDWDFVWLGGHHMKDPIPVSPGIVRSVHMDRCHAYGVRGKALKELYRFWHQWHEGHCDWAISQWVGKFNSYCCHPWIVGQRGGWSDILFRNKGPEWWQHGPGAHNPNTHPPVQIQTLEQREEQHLAVFPCDKRGKRLGVESRDGGCGVAPAPAYECLCQDNPKKKASLWRFCTQQDIPICSGCPWNDTVAMIYPRLTACFPVGRDVPRTLKTIERFYKTTEGMDVEMIVVCGENPVLHQLNVLSYPNLKVIVSEGNQSQGYNLASTLATGFFLMKWDESYAPQPDWLKNAIKTWNRAGANNVAYVGINDESEGFPNLNFKVGIGTREFFKTLLGGTIHNPHYQKHDEQEVFDIATANNVAIFSKEAKMMYVPSDRPDVHALPDKTVYDRRQPEFKRNYPAILK